MGLLLALLTCGHKGINFLSFLMHTVQLKPQLFDMDNKNGLDQDLDPNTFLSRMISVREPGPIGQVWNMTYAADNMWRPGIHHRLMGD